MQGCREGQADGQTRVGGGASEHEGDAGDRERGRGSPRRHDMT